MRSNRMLMKALFIPLILAGCVQAKIDPAAEALISKLASEGNVIVAGRTKGKIPIDPFDPAWQGAQELQVPLVSQTSIAPRTAPFNRFKISVRALSTRKEIGLLISWEDPTKDELETGVTRFRDAVAVGFPVNLGPRIPLPYIGMGNKGRPMNLWHWKASWQSMISGGTLPHPPAADAGPIPPNPSAPDGQSPILRRDPDEAGYPINHRTGEEAHNPISAQVYKSPVENLMAEGFGTLTSVPTSGLNGNGVWKDGRWSVVITRDRKLHGLVPISFAIWDGSAAERNGMKGLTRWRFLRFEGESVPIDQVKDFIIGPIPGTDPSRGKQLVSDMGCNSCHNLPNSPALNDIAPDLGHAGSIHRPEYLLESIKDPNAVIVPAPGYYDPATWTSKMPSFGDQIPDQDYNDIVEYLRSLI